MDVTRFTLPSLLAFLRNLKRRHSAIGGLPPGWERLCEWTGAHLCSLQIVVEDWDPGPRAAKAALLARLFWEARASARRFVTEPDSLLRFMNGALHDALEVCDALDQMANTVPGELGNDITRSVGRLREGVRRGAGDARLERWPWGRKLAQGPDDQKEYEALGTIFSKMSHATPFFILAPPEQREADAHVLFLAGQAAKCAADLLGILEEIARAEAWGPR